MFFRRQKPNSRPAVKKASELINSKSHNQKKYVSLMLVPSYSTGKTRSLRIPRVVLHGVGAVVFVISAVIFGFYLRSLHFERQARNLQYTLDETQGAFDEFQNEAELAQSELIDATVQMYEQLSEEQMRAQIELDRQERRHRDTIEDIWDHIDELENQMRDFDEEFQEIIDSLGARRIIPPIADLLAQLENSQANLRESLRPETGSKVSTPAQAPPAVGLLGLGTLSEPTRDELFVRLVSLLDELEIQRKLLEDLEFYKEKMSPYLLNYPTLWPVSGQISSGFGWRRNPMGGRNNEHHNGVDIPARTGTPIKAAGGGTVTFSGWNGGYGNTVIIDHGSGLSSMYAHNSRNRVTAGQRVERGETIAEVGSTGRSTGAHVHYEIRKNGTAQNPVPFLLEHHD
ncbi:MAG: peptidoglycan DD-metalloendopeptidase family protein [Defluviitaleaceae bacterium]|nr:peptidoglycan DD-metalloendopeptidase family protein [Defluviitaleaceae bacterium]